MFPWCELKGHELPRFVFSHSLNPTVDCVGHKCYIRGNTKFIGPRGINILIHRQ